MMGRLTFAFALWALLSIAVEAKDYDCVVDPDRTIKVGSPLVGLLSEVLVDRGDSVIRGQVVARLESTVEKATVDLSKAEAENTASLRQKEAQLALAQKAADRAHALAQTQSVSRKQIDEAESDVLVQTLQVENEKRELELKSLELARAEAALELKTIRSPDDGVVTERALSGGEYANQESHILTIARLSELRVETFLPVALYGQIAEGDTAIVEPDPPIGGDYKAKVAVVDHVFDAASKTFGVRLLLPNPGLRLPAGMRCKVRFGAFPPATSSLGP
ncbi:MAG: efflux RND transporter periplasmic adaptor subunit [Hyphomicrobiales bacterium]|nr:efflux RND transporter periplasmic adaptor subunit [Hyphomicrobiales bacterium]